MNRLSRACTATAMLCLILAGCDSSAVLDSGGFDDPPLQRPTYANGTCDAATGFDYCVHLVAGQNSHVGNVHYGYDGTSFQIKYETFGGHCLTEVHWGVFDVWDDIPFNRPGNLPPGRLPFADGNPDCDGFEDAVEITLSGNYFVAAHAVVGGGLDANCPIIAGIVNGNSPMGNHGDVWGVNPFSGFTTMLFDYQGPLADASDTSNWPNYPNGLGLHDASDNYYFFTLKGDAYDGTTSDIHALRRTVGAGDQVGNLERLSAGSVMHGDSYYYVPQSPIGSPWNQQANDDLRMVDVVTGVETIACGDFTGASNRRFEFGDLAIDLDAAGPLQIIGSAFDNRNGRAVFFRITDPGGSCALDEIDLGAANVKYQLAYGNDGTLIAHATDTGAFYRVTFDFAAETVDFQLLGATPGIRFNDLAPAAGTCDVVGTETAWGWGENEFPGNQWGWIFEGSVNGQ